jgi:retinoid hydroxylase
MFLLSVLHTSAGGGPAYRLHMSTIETPPPPGSDGLPLLGETLTFAKNPFRFIEERLATHGRIFRSNVLGRKTAVVAGPEAAGHFIDPNVIMREGAMPPHVQEIFGGRSLPLLDGEVHSARKKLVNQAFNRAAMAAYLPIIQQTVETYFHKWPAAGEIRWLDELKRLSIEVICTTVMGMPPGNEMDRMRTDYGILTDGFATLPINIPGTRYRKALQARDRILDVLRRLVRERRQTPSDDGLSRMLAAATSSGTALSDDDAALELHHIVIAGFIVYAELGSIVQQLTAHADVREKLAAEIASKAPSGPLSLETLMTMPYLLQVVNEVKRLCPIVPAVFGKTKAPLEFDGVSVPAGWMVMWAVTPSHVAQSEYTNPTTFDPDRFSPERAEDKRHEHAFAPQGAGPATGHRCPGLDFATYFMEIFAVALLRGYAWELPPQNYEMDFSKTPPEPKDALRATVIAR